MFRLFFVTLTTALILAAAPSAQAQKVQTKKVNVTVVNAARVYHPRNLSTSGSVKKLKPAVISAKAVFDETPEYKKIKSKGLSKNCAQYRLLTNSASTRFKNAIKRTMSLHGYDLIAESGAITVAGSTLTDITSTVIANLQ